jgi:hypothetical protein
LLLSGPVERGEFAADGHRGGGDGVLHGSRARAKIGFHGLNVIVMSPAVALLLSIVVTRRSCSTSISGMLLP